MGLFELDEAQLMSGGPVELFVTGEGEKRRVWRTRVLGMEAAVAWCREHLWPVQAMERQVERLQGAAAKAHAELMRLEAQAGTSPLPPLEGGTEGKNLEEGISEWEKAEHALGAAKAEFAGMVARGLAGYSEELVDVGTSGATPGQIIGAFMKLVQLTDPTLVTSRLSERLVEARTAAMRKMAPGTGEGSK